VVQQLQHPIGIVPLHAQLAQRVQRSGQHLRSRPR
jgi:hypothetical protein